jgi:glucan phosphorylase
MIENEYIFGAKVEDIERMKKEGYHPKALYDANPEIKRVVDTQSTSVFRFLNVTRRQRISKRATQFP